MVAVGVLIGFRFGIFGFINARGRDVDESEGSAFIYLEVSLEVVFFENVGTVAFLQEVHVVDALALPEQEIARLVRLELEQRTDPCDKLLIPRLVF